MSPCIREKRRDARSESKSRIEDRQSRLDQISNEKNRWKELCRCFCFAIEEKQAVEDSSGDKEITFIVKYVQDESNSARFR